MSGLSPVVSVSIARVPLSIAAAMNCCSASTVVIVTYLAWSNGRPFSVSARDLASAPGPVAGAARGACWP